MWVRRPTGAEIFSTLVVIGVIIFIALMLFFYVGAIALGIFLGIGVLIALVYALIIYVRSFVAAVRQVSGRSGNSLTDILRQWFTLFATASGIAFRENLQVAGNALNRSGSYRILSLRRWMWFMVAPATLIMGTLLICAVILSQLGIFCFLAFALVFALVAYLVLAFIGACGYAVICSVKYMLGEDLRGMFDFDFTLSATLPPLGSAIKNYFVLLWTACVNIWRNCFSMGQSNQSYASSYRLLMPQHVFLTATLIALPFVATVYDILLLVLGGIVFIPLVIVVFIWTLLAMLINKIRYHF